MTEIEQKSQLIEKMNHTKLLLSEVSEQDTKSLPVGFRVLHGITKTMPASILPVVLCWVLASVVATHGIASPVVQLRFLVLGMMTILSLACAIYLIYRAWGKTSLPDPILGDMAQFAHQLAYHPNMVLKKKVEKRGFATKYDYVVWAEEQKSILTTKLSDQKMQMGLAERSAGSESKARSLDVEKFLKM